MTKVRELMAILENPAVESWRSIFETMRLVSTQLESALQREGLSIPRFQILFHLYFDAPLAPSVLAERLLVTRGNISTFLRRLQKDGLIEPTKNGERVRPLYQLSQSGKELFEHILPRHAEQVENLVPPLTRGTLAELELVREYARHPH